LAQGTQRILLNVVIVAFLCTMLGRRLILPCLACLVTSSQGAYDEEEARNFASLASVTYCEDTKTVMDWTCTACKDSKNPLVPGKIRIVDGGNFNATRILIGKLANQNGCVMAFRGSDNVYNWVRDFQTWDITPTDYGNCAGCKVHSGFYDIWNKVHDSAMKALREVGCSPSANNVDNVLYVTGHSLGAGLTHLAMFSLQDFGFKIGKSYSFEAPRVGNKAFSETFSDRFSRNFPVFRITHSEDPVVHLPPEALGFQHVQEEVWYDSKGKFKVCPNVEDSACADQYGDIPWMVARHSGDHCASPLVPNGDICSPVGCASSKLVMV